MADRLVKMLRDSLPWHLKNRPLPFALDLHRRPYYGRFTRGVSRGKEKKSTKKAFAYATLVAFSDSGRFTVGLLQFRPYMRLTTALERLPRQAADADLRLARLLLDKEFYSAEVIAWLKRHDVTFLMPVNRREGDTGNGHLFAATTPIGWQEYSWTSRPRRHDFKTGKRQVYLRLLGLRLLLNLGVHLATLLGGLVDEWPSQRPLPEAFAPFESTP